MLYAASTTRNAAPWNWGNPLGTFESELKKVIHYAYVIGHCITRSFLLQTTLNSVLKRFSKYQNWVLYFFSNQTRNYFGALGQAFFQKALYYVNWFYKLCMQKSKKENFWSIFYFMKTIFFLNYLFGIIWKSPHFFHHKVIFLDLCFILAQFLYTSRR